MTSPASVPLQRSRYTPSPSLRDGEGDRARADRLERSGVRSRRALCRRSFIALASAAAWPLAVRGQPAMPVIGFLHQSSLAGNAPRRAAFQRGLAEAGFSVGRNVAIEYRWADDRYERLPALAAELIDRRVAAIFAANLGAALALKATSTMIPSVFLIGVDPVEAGLVASFSRPGGTMTGVAVLTAGLGAKRLELLRDFARNATRMGVLVNPSSQNAAVVMAEVQAAARALGLQVEIATASAERELEPAFAALAQARAEALLVGADAAFTSQRERIVALAARHALPASYAVREFVEAGGLMSYGPSFNDAYRQAGVYIGRILRGERPADLPVVQPTRFELALNLRTAGALGFAVPPTLLALADEVIE